MKEFKVEESMIIQNIGLGQLEIYQGKALIPWYILILDFFRNSFKIFTRPL